MIRVLGILKKNRMSDSELIFSSTNLREGTETISYSIETYSNGFLSTPMGTVIVVMVTRLKKSLKNKCKKFN